MIEKIRIGRRDDDLVKVNDGMSMRYRLPIITMHEVSYLRDGRGIVVKGSLAPWHCDA